MGNSNPILTHCRFEGNTFDAMRNRSSSPVITGCQFIRNTGDAIDAQDCNSILTDCLFDGGERGLDCSGGHLSLTGCTFTNFWVEAIYAITDLTLVRAHSRTTRDFVPARSTASSAATSRCWNVPLLAIRVPGLGRSQARIWSFTIATS